MSLCPKVGIGVCSVVSWVIGVTSYFISDQRKGAERMSPQFVWFGGECEVCGGWVSRTNYARHVRRCREILGEAAADVGEELGVGEARGGMGERTRGRVAECPRCGRTLSYSNMARHRESCRVWDPGGGPRP